MKKIFNMIGKPFNRNEKTFENSDTYTKFMEYYAPAYDSILQEVAADLQKR